MGEFSFGHSVRKLHGNYGKVLFTKTYIEVKNINRKPLIWSKYKIITKYGPKKWVSLVFGKVHENCPKRKEKVLFYETYFDESNINQKALICSNDKKITKLGQKKWVSLDLGKVYENNPKNKEKCYFTKLTLKRVISTGNHLFVPKIR